MKDQLKSKATVHKSADLQEKCNNLQRRIEKWQDIQAFYMPGVLELRATAESSRGGNTGPEHISLYLPSGLPSHLHQSPSLVQKEKRLHIAQAEDSLTELRRLLRVTLGL